MSKWRPVWVVGARARGRSGAPNLSGAPGPVEEGAGCWRAQPEGLWRLGRVASLARAGTQEKSGGCADLLPAAARRELGRPEAGVRCARVSVAGERPAASAAPAHPASCYRYSPAPRLPWKLNVLEAPLKSL